MICGRPRPTAADRGRPLLASTLDDTVFVFLSHNNYVVLVSPTAYITSTNNVVLPVRGACYKCFIIMFADRPGPVVFCSCVKFKRKKNINYGYTGSGSMGGALRRRVTHDAEVALVEAAGGIISGDDVACRVVYVEVAWERVDAGWKASN